MDTPRTDLLLVEDSDDDVFFFRRTLAKSGVGCTLHRVANGAEAIEYLQTIQATDSKALPKAIFLDLKMPVLNGFEVLDWLKGQSFTPQLRVIVLSGSEHQNDKARATEMGATDYLVKPVSTGDLNRFLKDLCHAKPQSGASH